jgi:hypothetical protein
MIRHIKIIKELSYFRDFFAKPKPSTKRHEGKGLIRAASCNFVDRS